MSNKKNILLIFSWLMTQFSVFGQNFIHPGILNNKTELDLIKSKIKAGEQPWKSAFEKLEKSKYASLNYAEKPFLIVDCGSYNKPNLGCDNAVEDGMAVYCNALIWYFTDDKKHAEKAIKIINAWSSIYEKNTNSNSRLVVSWATPWFVNGAEILKYTNSEWKTEDIVQFNGLLDKFLPYVLDETMPGNNWVLSSIEAHLAIAVFKDDKALFDKGIERWKVRTKTYIFQSSDGKTPLNIPNKTEAEVAKVWRSSANGTVYIDGLGMETCRDLGHLNLGFSSMIYAAEIAWQQGVDLFSEEKKRLTDFMELHGSWMTGAVQVPADVCEGKVKAKLADSVGIQSPKGGGQIGWEIAYNHLHDRLNIALPYSLKMIEKTRPTEINKWVRKGETLTHGNRVFSKNESKVSVLKSEFILLNQEALLKNKKLISEKDTAKIFALKKLIKKADKIVKEGKLYSVMHKKKTPPSGDKHDYMSQAPYWWADSTKKNGLPYIRRDGERNPEYYDISDSDEMDKLEDDSEVLGLAYYFTNDEKYASFCSKLFKTWFLDKETKQNPNFNFSQGIPGINDGRGIGIIESRELLKIADAAILMKGSKNWTENDHEALKKWYADYLTWMKENPLGKDEEKEHNNHGTFYDVQVVAYSLFTDNPALAEKQIEVTKKRIQSQLQPDGSQPFELERTVSWGYVNMNLWGFIQIAKMAEKVNIDLWKYETSDGKNLQKAVDWLIPYLKKEKKWTYKQIKKMTYEDTIDLMKLAAIAYKKSEYESSAKMADVKIYGSEIYQLTF